MRRKVFLTEGAQRDLEDIYRYVAESASIARADSVLDRLIETAQSLSAYAERGSTPRELRSLGIQAYRELVVGPYRLIYRTLRRRVVVYVIADGRRDMQSLLLRRLVGR